MRPQIISPHVFCPMHDNTTTRETMAVWENSEEEFSEAPWHVKGNHETFDLRTSGPDVPLKCFKMTKHFGLVKYSSPR